MAINQQPVTLPRFNLTDIDIELEAKEAAERVIERRTIREGLDSWREINRNQSFPAQKFFEIYRLKVEKNSRSLESRRPFGLLGHFFDK